MAGVHAQRDLRLPAVTTEMAFTDEQAQEEPHREIGLFRLRVHRSGLRRC
jgi:hypothetical protein